MINKNRLIKLTQQLIRIDSQNPPGDEYAIASFVKKYLRSCGLNVQEYEFKRRRTNIIATIRAKGKCSLLITPHLDTVPSGSGWRMPALGGRLYANKIYGLGATDCKGNLACAMEVLESLREDKVSLQYTLIFAATADEECGSDPGIIPLLSKKIITPTQALVLDADNFSIIVTQKGLVHVKVKLQGKRCHGAYPWRGINAIDAAVRIIHELKESAVRSKVINKYLRPSTMNVGTIRGGDKVNVVAPWCELELDFRFLPGEYARTILENLRRIVRRHSRKFAIEIEGIQQPYAISQAHPLVTHLSAAFKAVGKRPIIKGSEGATVITFFQKQGIPAVATGFGSAGCAHSVDEYATVENLYKGSLALEKFLRNYTM